MKDLFYHIVFKVRRLVGLIRISLRIIRIFGFGVFFKKLKCFILKRLGYYQCSSHSNGIDLNSHYDEWISRTRYNSYELKLKEHAITKFKYKPLISIIFPVYNVDEKWLRLALDSVRSQIYKNWELCIVDDASTLPHIKPVLEEYKNRDPRIKVHYSDTNEHICGASNRSLDMATGEFVFLMDNDDEIEPNTLYEFVRVLNEKDGHLDFIYPDEDQITPDGKRVNPIFKPDWSPETILSMMFATRGLFRTEIVRSIGGFRKGYEGSQDYDLVLRFSEKTTVDRIYHIPMILYHWRRVPGSTAENYNAKPYARLAARKALEDTIKRRRMEAILEDGLTPPSFHIKRKIRNNPKVSIIIPTKDLLKYVKRCIESVEKKTVTDGFNYEIILVDNNSVQPESLRYFEHLAKRHKVLQYTKPFNYSAINNYAVQHADGDYLLFLNNDTEVINPEWLYEMLQLAQEDEIAAVGAKLIFPDNTIQHAGVHIYIDRVAEHTFYRFDMMNEGYLSRIQIINNVSAVTGACLMIKQSLFEKLGGFDEVNLPVAFNDVDLCLKAQEAGYRNVYTPFARLYHYESLSRGYEDTPEKMARLNREQEYMLKRWKDYLTQDKYWNPNLIMENGMFFLNFDVKKII
ncbi:MAG: glycosyl transferase family 2 [Candidatus Dojkabacteria bacterium]|nr:MAG: glycosyl transferase family 2 [Candidatus Dojkabacteria bacterium]